MKLKLYTLWFAFTFWFKVEWRMWVRNYTYEEKQRLWEKIDKYLDDFNTRVKNLIEEKGGANVTADDIEEAAQKSLNLAMEGDNLGTVR